VTAQTSKGEPVPDAIISLLPDPPRREQYALRGTCVADARGTCTLRGVAPGDYHVFAVTKDSGRDLRDPDTFKDLEKQSKAVRVAEGDRLRVELEAAADDQ
jgi:protocatechuate 3,4-dioxygenase beta subunit